MCQIIFQTILEAQELAVNEHNVEYKSNLWIGNAIFVHFYLNFSFYFSFKYRYTLFLYACMLGWIFTQPLFGHEIFDTTHGNALGNLIQKFQISY